LSEEKDEDLSPELIQERKTRIAYLGECANTLTFNGRAIGDTQLITELKTGMGRFQDFINTVPIEEELERFDREKLTLTSSLLGRKRLVGMRC
jgi:hypothetical protein